MAQGVLSLHCVTATLRRYVAFVPTSDTPRRRSYAGLMPAPRTYREFLQYAAAPTTSSRDRFDFRDQFGLADVAEIEKPLKRLCDAKVLQTVGNGTDWYIAKAPGVTSQADAFERAEKAGIDLDAKF